MSAVPAVLLWVQEVGFDQRRKANVLFGHDFREDFDWLFVDIPPDLFALRSGERLTLRDIYVSEVHRFSKGWAWETTTPERLPEPPFLLTDDEDCRLVFRGSVAIRPSALGREEMGAQFEEDGNATVPVLGDSWFGILQVDASDDGRGQLEAFSREGTRLPSGEMEVICACAGEHETFGQLIVP